MYQVGTNKGITAIIVIQPRLLAHTDRIYPENPASELITSGSSPILMKLLLKKRFRPSVCRYNKSRTTTFINLYAAEL